MGMIQSGLQSIKHLESHLGDDNKKSMRRCILLSFIATAALYTVPYTCGVLLNKIVDVGGGGDVSLDMILDLGTMVTILVIFWYVSNAYSKRRMTLIALSTAKMVREGLNRKMMKASVRYVDERPAGELISAFTSDFPIVFRLISSDYISFIVHGTMIIAVLIMMVIASYQLAILYLLLLPITLIVSRRLTNLSEPDFKKQREKESELNSQMSDIISSHRTIKAENLEDEMRKKFNDTNDEFTNAYIAAQSRSSLITPMVNIMVNMGYLITVIVGALMLFFNYLQVGMLLSFMIYVRIINKPLLNTATVFDNLREGMISLERVLNILEAPEEEEVITEKKDVDGDIVFDNVSFSYIDGHEVLHNVSLRIRSGEITAIAGRTGSGKTTIANLILRFYRPQSGTISIGGIDVTDISRHDLSMNVGTVLQDPWVFDGSIRENIIYNRSDITEEEMIRVTSLTGLDNYVKNLPEGYDTLIGDDVRRLPLPQRRMIAMSRAIIGKPKILIFDEAVAGLDPITGSNLLEKISDYIEGRTVLLITHNKALIDISDNVIYLQDGNVISGNTN
ncbi:MAG: ABC transporter ATP-binding protein [Candidatus Methanomethylophilaceae archaeon]|nr:ABC transporter ATP-binding protein [Candidatus Methanomethylophilaceae archaeon]